MFSVFDYFLKLKKCNIIILLLNIDNTTQYNIKFTYRKNTINKNTHLIDFFLFCEYKK